MSNDTLAQVVEDEWNSDAFKHGLEVGKSLGHYASAKKALAAHAAGEIELWLDLQRPKTMDQWDAWESKHGTTSEVKARWGSDDEKSSPEVQEEV